MSREQFQQYWLEKHAPLVRKNAKAVRIKRYVQNHTVPDNTEIPLNKTARESRGGTEAYDGVVELWFESAEDLFEAYSTPEGVQALGALLEDEKNFIDLARSSIFFAEERVIIGD
jgi:uncharacterized protein (TIGR02118 family)